MIGSQLDGYNITVMFDTISTGYNGIHNRQYVQLPGSMPSQSAANLFTYYLPSINEYNYFIEDWTNDLLLFDYRRDASQFWQEPWDRSPFPLFTAASNGCPLYYGDLPGDPPTFSFSSFQQRIATLERDIDNIETRKQLTSSDTNELSALYSLHEAMIDSAVRYYQSARNMDSLTLVYAQIKKGFQHQVYRAFAYKSLKRFDDAIALFNGISDEYDLTKEENQQVRNLATIFKTLQWLDQHNENWSEMPDNLKMPVYDYEVNDWMYAGAIARTLLTVHENRVYNPVYRMPTKRVSPQNGKYTLQLKNDGIYPNPASEVLSVNFNGGETGQLVIFDVTGKEVLREPLNGGPTNISIARLIPGLYIAEISVEGKIRYKEKLVKN